jgi:hypothetical protein
MSECGLNFFSAPGKIKLKPLAKKESMILDNNNNKQIVNLII